MGSVKCKITKILNSEDNTKQKFPNQMAKSNDKTHQTNGQQRSRTMYDDCTIKKTLVLVAIRSILGVY